MTLQQQFERALMEETLSEDDFVLALALHKTLAEIGAMSNREFLAWKAYFAKHAALDAMKKGSG